MDTKLIVRQDVTYHLLNDPGLVRYTQDIDQVYAKLKDFNNLKQQIDEDIQTSLSALQNTVEQNKTDLDKQIKDLKQSLEGKLGTLQSTLESTKGDLEPRVKALEDELSGVKERLDTLI